ncbi:MAG: copper homeostasis protein CutC [Chitinophagaceae bacterium]|nr:copper homeostasis protein CutC [Chitinophagaceae bacterium]
MSSQRLFEVCAFNIQSAIVAQKAGAARVELCDNPVEGGTTPSHGTIKATRERIDISLYPIIRPRAGNYLYDDDEFSIMHRDILLSRDLGCNGISVGIQKINGEIDTERLKRIVEWAGTMGVTCNRVFDCAPDPFKALEDIIGCGCERILTSGLKSAAPDAADLLKKLVDTAGDRIIIMPGAGIKSSNVRKLAQQTNAREFHGSARKIANNPVTFLNKEVSDYGNVYISDEEEVRQIIGQLNY